MGKISSNIIAEARRSLDLTCGVAVSSDSRHIAFLSKSRQRIVHDRRSGPSYDEVRCPVFSSNGRLAYMASRKGKWFFVTETESPAYDAVNFGVMSGKDSMPFSADGNHVAYVAKLDNESFVVVDGNAKNRYDTISNLRYSPDSQHVAYIGRRADQFFVVFDDHTGGPYSGVDDRSLIFSPDSTRLAYTACCDQDGNYIVVDGKKSRSYSKVYGRSLKFSPDSRRLAFLVQTITSRSEYPTILHTPTVPKRLTAMVLDEVMFTDYRVPESECGDLFDEKCDRVAHFSPDGKHFAFIAAFGGQVAVIMDGREGKHYKEISDLQFSSNSRHVAFIGTRLDNGVVAVINGQESKPYSEIRMLQFSPDGEHLAYAARPFDMKPTYYLNYAGVLADKGVVVHDGAESRDIYSDISNLCFSLDSRRLAFAARENDNQFLVIDEVRQPKDYYGHIDAGFGHFALSSDGVHTAYWGAELSGPERLVVDGKTVLEGPESFPDAKILFDDSTHLHTLIIEDQRVFREESKVFRLEMNIK